MIQIFFYNNRPALVRHPCGGLKKMVISVLSRVTHAAKDTPVVVLLPFNFNPSMMHHRMASARYKAPFRTLYLIHMALS